MNTFGRALKLAREKKQLSMRAVALSADLSPQTILRAERGEFIRFEVGLQVADALKLPATETKSLMSRWVDDEMKRYAKNKRKN